MPMRTEALLLCGPAGTGKTDRMIDEYIRHSDTHGDDGVALILPAAQAATRVSKLIVARCGRHGLFDPRIFTFPTLAETLLDANHKPVRRISSLQQRLLVRDVVKRLVAEGRLPYLSGVSEYRGFVAAVSSVIDELKRAAVEPSEFVEIARRRIPDHPANADVSAIYEAYQRELTQRKLYDEPGAFWEARDLLRAGQRRPLERASLLLVDGFSEFTTTQIEVLQLLCEGVQRCVVTLSIEPEGRPQLFAVPRRTRDRLGRSLADVADVQEEWLEPPRPASALAGLRQCVFGEADAGALEDDDSVQVIGAPGVRAEAREIARRAKRLILDGTPPDEIAVVLRSMDGYDLAVRDAFADYGVPVEVSGKQSLGRIPAVQAVLDILDVITGGYRRADVVKLLNSNYVDSQDLLTDGQPPTADEFESIALKANTIGGRQEWGTQLGLLSRRLTREHERAQQAVIEDEDEERPRTPEAINREREAVERCGRMLNGLFALLDRVEKAATLPAAVRALGATVTTLRIVERARDDAPDLQGAARDLQGLSALLNGLRELGESGRELGAAEVLEAGDFPSLVRELADSEAAPADPRFGGAVQVLNVHEARQLRYRHVFVPGLTEGVFPRARRQDPFYHDDARRRLSANRVVLEARLPQQSEETFLFYAALSAATECVWLSYTTSDAQGQPSLRSHYLDEALSHFSKPPREDITRLSQVTVTTGAARCPRELAESAMQTLWREPAETTASDGATMNAVEALRKTVPELLQRSTRGAAAEDERDSRRRLGKFDGVVEAPAVQAVLRSDFGTSHKYSAGQFSAYGRCPMAFFLERVLGLEALEDPTEEVESRDLGNIAHRTLNRFFAERTHGRDNWRPLGSDELEAEMARMDAELAKVFAEWNARGLVPHRKLWDITHQQLRDDLRALLEFETKENAGGKAPPRAVWANEVPYGEDADFGIGEGEDRVLVRGRIDRIDVVPGTTPLQYVVLDYKTGRGGKAGDILNGIDFQLPLYCLAAREVFEGHTIEPLYWAYYCVRRKIKFAGKVPASRIKVSIEDALEAAARYVHAYAGAIRSGWFALQPKVCTDYCAFKGICRYSAHRVARKEPAPDAGAPLESGTRGDQDV